MPSNSSGDVRSALAASCCDSRSLAAGPVGWQAGKRFNTKAREPVRSEGGWKARDDTQLSEFLGNKKCGVFSSYCINYSIFHPHEMLFLWPYVAGSLCQSTKGTVREAMRNRSIHWLIDQVVSAWCFIILRLVAFGWSTPILFQIAANSCKSNDLLVRFT